MKKIIFTLVLLITLLLSVSFAQKVEFGNDLGKGGYLYNKSNSWTCYNNSTCYIWAKITLPYSVSYDYLKFMIFRYKYQTLQNDARTNYSDWEDYDEIILENSSGQTFDWAAKQLYFYDEGYYLIGIYSPAGVLMGSGIIYWDF